MVMLEAFREIAKSSGCPTFKVVRSATVPSTGNAVFPHIPAYVVTLRVVGSRTLKTPVLMSEKNRRSLVVSYRMKNTESILNRAARPMPLALVVLAKVPAIVCMDRLTKSMYRTNPLSKKYSLVPSRFGVRLFTPVYMVADPKYPSTVGTVALVEMLKSIVETE
jgi:hypothetical protein